MAIRWREHDGFGGDIAAGPGAVLDDEGLPEPVGQPLSEKPRKDVGRTTRCKADDDAHRPRRIGLRPSEARDGRERDSTRGQMQKLPAEKFHFAPPSRFTSFDQIVDVGEQRRRDFQAERLRGTEVDHQLELRRPLDR